MVAHICLGTVGDCLIIGGYLFDKIFSWFLGDFNQRQQRSPLTLRRWCLETLGKAKMNTGDLSKILEDTRSRLLESENSDWAARTCAELIVLIDANLNMIELDGTFNRCDLDLLFAPTSSLQETAIDNGWGEEFLGLSSRYDKAVENTLFANSKQTNNNNLKTETNDIDQITTEISKRRPSILIAQLKAKHPSDDNGIWYLRMPGIHNEIQLESWNGQCPFAISDNNTGKVLTGSTVLDVVSKIEILLNNTKKLDD